MVLGGKVEGSVLGDGRSLLACIILLCYILPGRECVVIKVLALEGF
jgi:hypothetical protein